MKELVGLQSALIQSLLYSVLMLLGLWCVYKQNLATRARINPCSVAMGPGA